MACVARSLPRVERVLYPAPPSIIVKSGSSIQTILCRCIGCVRNIPMGIPDSLRMPYSSVSSTCYSLLLFIYYLLCYLLSVRSSPKQSFISALTLSGVYNYLQAQIHNSLQEAKPNSCAPCGIDTLTSKRLQLNPVHLHAIRSLVGVPRHF